jgi:hypothetical protein
MFDSLNSSKKAQCLTHIYFVVCTFVWMALMVFIDKAILYNWIESTSLINTLIVLDVILGMLTIYMFIKMLAAMDEMQRKIQFDALAFTMGATLVAAVTYSLLTTAMIVNDSETSDLILFMTFCYMLSIGYGQVKYR